MSTRICAFSTLSRRHYILNDTCRPEKAVMRRDIALIRAGCVFCSLHNLCQKMLTSIMENYTFFTTQYYNKGRMVVCWSSLGVNSSELSVSSLSSYENGKYKV